MRRSLPRLLSGVAAFDGSDLSEEPSQPRAQVCILKVTDLIAHMFSSTHPSSSAAKPAKYQKPAMLAGGVAKPILQGANIMSLPADVFGVLSDHLTIESLAAVQSTTAEGWLTVSRGRRWTQARLESWLMRLDDGNGDALGQEGGLHERGTAKCAGLHDRSSHVVETDDGVEPGCDRSLSLYDRA